MDGSGVIFLVGALIGAGVGAAIDRGKGALWGLFLGPIGWIIAAILKSKDADSIVTVVNSEKTVRNRKEKVTDKREPKKWSILKEIDADIRSAANRIRMIDDRLELVLAEKFLELDDKRYLDNLVASIIEKKSEHLTVLVQNHITPNRLSDGSILHNGYVAFADKGKFIVCGQFFDSAEDACAEIDDIIDSGKEYRLDLHRYTEVD